MFDCMPVEDFSFFNEMTNPMIVIYLSPLGFPGKAVGRFFSLQNGEARPRPLCVVKDTYESLLALKPPQCIIIPRHPEDDANIKEVWL